MADRSAENAESIEALRADLGRLREDIASLTRHLSGAADETADTVRDRVRETARQTGEAARQTRDAARDQVERGRSSIENEFRDRPVTVLGIAFGTGLLIGRLFGR